MIGLFLCCLEARPLGCHPSLARFACGNPELVMERSINGSHFFALEPLTNDVRAISLSKSSSNASSFEARVTNLVS